MSSYKLFVPRVHLSLLRYVVTELRLESSRKSRTVLYREILDNNCATDENISCFDIVMLTKRAKK